MKSTVVSKLVIAAVAAAGLAVPAVAVTTPVAAASPASTGDCLLAAVAPALADDVAPADSCTDQKEACMAGGVQETTFGGRYVPTEVVAMCMDAYRQCVNSNTDSDSDAVG